MKASLLILGSIVVAYTLIPFVLSRWFGIGACRKVSKAVISKRQIALTFDDGPNPEYTNQLLDLLNQHQIKASFFVVGSKAEKYPEVILRIHQEGHLIGIHNYAHQSNWLMSPWKVNRYLEKSAKVIEKITGSKPMYYRPPWGMLNLFDFFIHKNWWIILWSLMVGDWRSSAGSKEIARRLLAGVKAGDIIVLHDSGETWGADDDAPQQTITALKTVLPELHYQGYTFVRIDQWVKNEKRSDL